MLTKLEIENFKSIHKESIDLGRVNVFIGENGCGKTNILEGLGMVSAVKDDGVTNNELSLKGIRVTKPSITVNSFSGLKTKKKVIINSDFEGFENDVTIDLTTILETADLDEINSNWKYRQGMRSQKKGEYRFFDEIESSFIAVERDLLNIKNWAKLGKIGLDDVAILKKIYNEQIKILPEIYTGQIKGVLETNNIEEIIKEYENFLTELAFLNEIKNANNILNLNEFKIYNLSTRILRGIGGTNYEIPGIHGENLDVLINSFSKEEMEELEEHASMISWLDKIIIDKEDALKLQGHKLNLSQSKLYFRDKFMQKKNNVFSAENANEGILHALFYIALFISKKTPKLFAIDNIETALNPYLGRVLIEKLIKLAKKYDKQVLITTHNPSILDGINLHDDEQRLFAVERNFKGHTTVERIQIKPDKNVGGQRLKLSELWMRNYLGAIPQYL